MGRQSIRLCDYMPLETEGLAELRPLCRLLNGKIADLKLFLPPPLFIGGKFRALLVARVADDFRAGLLVLRFSQ